ncbi:hypothetical protein J1605_008348 [Eschrichtius robustus]|uniref:Uncharacterized protein n=1 Tax=Eschrichtius robustus TaxID=9764 RepID=A0AB34GY64_ESCRO|nr:hypothetical protein J1605_008348 [Eschrichtius robustus]
MTGVLVRREEETGTDTPSGGGQVMTEAEGEDGSLKPRTDSSPQKLEESMHSFKVYLGTSLVAQWLRIRLPMQGTRVRALVWEDPTCRGATKPVRHNYWACAPEPASHNY